MTSNSRVLVCGGTGFIGRNVAQYLLEKGYDVTATRFTSPPWHHDKLKWISVDLRDPVEVDKLLSKFDIIVQAAATTSGSADIVKKPHVHVTDNAVMNSYIFRAAFDHNVRHVIFFSCSVMYPSREHPQKETDAGDLSGIHQSYFGAAWTKLYLEKLAEFYSRQATNTKWSVLRHSNVYGPWDKFGSQQSHVFAATVDKVMRSTKESITVWGDGKETRDLLYIDDLLSAIDLVIVGQSQEYLLANVGGGVGVSIECLVNSILRKSGRTLKVVYDRSLPTIKTNIVLDSGLIKELLGWQPQYNLDAGIEQTLLWYKDQLCP